MPSYKSKGWSFYIAQDMVPVTPRKIWTSTKLRYGDCCNASEDMGSYLLTYLLTYSMSRVLLEKLTGSAASQEIHHIFGT